MDVGVEYNAEFWPIEHPVEPPDEDQPVKCPMPDSSVIKVSPFIWRFMTIFVYSLDVVIGTECTHLFT